MKRKDKTEKNQGCFIDTCNEPLKRYDRKSKTGACEKHEDKWLALERIRDREETLAASQETEDEENEN